ncbi:MAG: tRNA (adenosine(37)-N6)-threonylcarbamoyltransferase complex transferase subunit TsaD [Planctomycetota bacterium]
MTSRSHRPTLLLGIESSCDETAASVVAEGYDIRSSVVHSQVAEHARFGGVVPELAGRSHLEQLVPTIRRALDDARVSLADLSAIAVTNRPGLIGSLLIGLSAAKALALTRGLPLVPVHHIEAHVHAATMESLRGTGGREEFPWPAVALVVSGGHTALYRVDSALSMRRLASTLDDAAGEAFDKVAWLLGLSYPGGPSVSKLAEEGNPRAVAFPRYRPKDGGLGFSFSGLKTAVLYHLRGGDALAPTPPPDAIEGRADVAASFQEAVVESLTTQTLRAAQQEGVATILVAGGVACNKRLREVLTERAAARGIRAHFPAPMYCTDNAAMIAGLGYELLRAGQTADLAVDASARA